jgi:adenylate cyclase
MGEDAAPARKASWLGGASQRRRLAVALLALFGMLAMVAPYFKDTLDTRAPRATHGVLDLSRHGPLSRPIDLSGQWRFVWLAGPGPAAGTSGWLDVPGFWEGTKLGGLTLPPKGRAKYELTIRGLAPGQYRMHVPPIYAASRITLDGRPVSHRGTLGDDARSTRYYHRGQDFGFASDGSDLRVGVELAAFLHRDNGIDQTPVFGLARGMEDWSIQKWSRAILYNASLILVILLAFVGFLYRPRDRASIYLGLAGLAFLPSMMVLGHDNLMMIQFPGLTFRQMLGIQYISATFAIPFFAAMIHALYPREGSRLIFRLVVGAYALVFLAQAFAFTVGDTVLASYIGRLVFMPLTVATLIYLTGVTALAAVRGRDGAIVHLVGTGLFVASYIVMALIWTAIFTTDELRSYELTTLGAVMILYSQVVVMAERWSLGVVRSEQDNEDLRQLLEVNTAITSDLQLGSLLDKIVSVTSKIIRADRSSLFLKDEHNPELASLVAQGVEEGPIRIDVGRGLAGYVFATGETVNLPDAYADERFNRAVDEATGYRTRSVLTVPITARDGRRIGVMQALNHEDGEPFTAEDAARMSAFGAQAAVAIDNARLFSEAVSARNFDDSILRSMSGGVIALDRDWKITKLNAAASEILGAPKTLLVGLEARALLGQNNPWLVAEIEAVEDGGEPRLLLDVELVSARAKPSSVNVTITRLEGEDGPAGILLVIEDISEGKRLQGTMRRFMTQAVVEQVLARDDEALFGIACEASVLFADVRGFTSMAEELSARETVETLNELFTELYEAVSDNDGVLDKYIGDAVMAVFGAPISSGRDPQNALAAGLEMLRMLDAINLRRRARGQEPMRIGIGIASGEVVAGTIGSPKRMDYTVIGDSVNLAARLQDLTKAYGVEMLVDEATARAIRGSQPLREIDLIAVRGRKRPETVHQVLAREPADPAQHAAYARGRELLSARDWVGAAAAFAEAAELDPDDRPARLMQARARMLAGAPPSEPWDGVWRDQAAAA